MLIEQTLHDKKQAKINQINFESEKTEKEKLMVQKFIQKHSGRLSQGQMQPVIPEIRNIPSHEEAHEMVLDFLSDLELHPSSK